MSDWRTTSALALGTVLTVLYISRRALWCKNRLPYPPGPPGLPWVGTVTGVDADAPWITYTKWAKVYGDIIHSRLFGNNIIVLNSEKVAKDLLENRSKNYSDRPHSIISENCGLSFETIFLSYGEHWRLHRRFFHQSFRPDAVHRFLPSQHRKACHLLRRLLDSPEQLRDHVFEYTSAIIMNSTYDYDPASRKDELVEMVSNVLNIAVPLIRPDVTIIVGAFPWLLYLPTWFPGMSFKKDMATVRELSKEYLERPFEHALQKVRSGSVGPSMIHDALRGMEEKGILPEASWMDALKGASATAFLGASETSNSVLMTFFLMMAANQGAQQRAQAEIDAVVSRDKLPSIDDRLSMPFIDAILRETLRYNPVIPLSFPHAAVDDDVYEGFHIPKGATLLANVWAMSRDESRYPNAHAFVPERFINEGGSLKPNDIEHLAYGFGRRNCVGRHFADTSLWSVMAKVLAIFKILKPVDENGVEMQLEPKFTTGNSVHPLPFKCRIVARFPGMDADRLDQLIAASSP